MLEKESGQGLNARRNELIKVCAVIGYRTLPVEDGLWDFTRPLYPSSRFPRFHLKITEKDSRLDAELHLDIRHHRGRTFGISLSEELERLIKIIVAEQNPSIFAAQLLNALKNQVLFGTSEARKRRNTVEKKFTAGAKKKKMKKGTRARFLNRRYSLDERDQSDLE